MVKTPAFLPSSLFSHLERNTEALYDIRKLKHFAVLFVYIDKEQFNKFQFVEQNSTISDRSKVETEAAREPFPVPLRQKKRWEKGETP